MTFESPASEGEAEIIQSLAPRFSLPVTVCVLCYGDHPALCRRFLDGLVKNTPAPLFRLRAGMNAVGEATRALLEETRARHSDVRLYDSPTNLLKYPMMRRLFHEPPLETEWTVWFDDDSYVERSDWLRGLALRAEATPDAEVLGPPRAIRVAEDMRTLVHEAPWSQGRPFEKDAAGEETIRFPAGGFWAIRSRTLTELDWPDVRLKHNGGDVLLGEALRQTGRLQRGFHHGVRVNACPRRIPMVRSASRDGAEAAS